MVLSGKYQGAATGIYDKYLAIIHGGKLGKSYTLVTRNNITHIYLEDYDPGGFDSTGAIIGAQISGALGALIVGTRNESVTVSVTWKSGEVCYLSLSRKEYDALLAGWKEEKTPAEWENLDQQANRSAESRNRSDVIFWTVVVGLVFAFFLWCAVS